MWQQQGSGTLAVGRPVTLVYDNGEGLQFRRTIAVDDNYLFTIKDEVTNKGAAPVTLYPYALISRHGTPQTLGYYILHEGLIGVLGDKLAEERPTPTSRRRRTIAFTATNGWLGITDKYWAATLLPDTSAADRRAVLGGPARQQQDLSDRLSRPDAQTIAPGATGAADARLFAGAKEVAIVDGYDKQLELNKFDLLIDWGWFYFITKPLFLAIDWIYQPRRQFRRRHPDRHRADQDHLLPARQQVLRLDGEDEGGAAGDDGDPRALSPTTR